jgi:anti-sigma regulatory factor (Ser/Thr protein kinase)
VHLTLHDNDPDYLVLEVVDQGGSFAPDLLPDPREADHLLDDHGRGWLIIRHLMDEVQVISDEMGTRLIMKKKRPTTH